MGGVFYLIGVVLAGYAGYKGLEWYFIFFSSLIMAIGYLIIRAPQIHGLVSQDGAVAIPKMLLIQVLMYAIITAPIYFIAKVIS